MRRFLCVAAVVGLTAVLATPAQAARHSIDSTIKFADIARTGTFPITGTEEYAGTIKGALGSGAIVGHNVFGPVPAFHGTARIFLSKGTVKVSLEGTGAPTPPPNPGGTGFDFSGTGEVTSGNGKYKGAHGKFTFSGSGPTAADPPTATIVITGSLKY